MIYAIVAVIVLILDQGLKYWTVSNIVLDTGTVPLIDGLVHLTHVRNYGAAFSILQNTRWLLVALTVVFVVAVTYALCAGVIKGAFGRWSALLVLAGAIGNGIDRLFVGYVVDMIELEFISFPVFNIADIFVTVFGIAFCCYIVFHRSPEPEESAEPTTRGFSLPRRDTEPERRGGDIEMLGHASVRMAQQQRREAAAAAAPKAEPRRFDPANPFAEWEDGMPAAAKAPAAAAVKEPPREAASEPYISPSRSAEPPRPAAQAPKSAPADDSSEFDLESILAEFRD